MATHSSLLAWRIPWTEEPGGYSPWGPKEPNMTERLNSKNFASSLHLTHAGYFPRERRGLNRCSGVEGPRGGSRGSISVRPQPQRAESLAGTRWGWDNHTQVHQAVGGGGWGRRAGRGARPSSAGVVLRGCCRVERHPTQWPGVPGRRSWTHRRAGCFAIAQAACTTPRLLSLCAGQLASLGLARRGL